MRQSKIRIPMAHLAGPIQLGALSHAGLAAILGILLAQLANADPNDLLFGFAIQAGASQDDAGRSVAVDDAGNVYVIGDFRQTVDFDSGPAVSSLTSAGSSDVFVCAYDATGSLLWARSIGGSSGDAGTGIALDAAGNIYLTGNFAGTADFDPGPGVFSLNSAGSTDVFVCGLTGTGDFRWAVRAGDTGVDGSRGIATGIAGDLYISGRFEGTADFDPESGAATLTSAGNQDAFIWRLDDMGNYLWAGSLGGGFIDHADAIAVDSSGNAYVTGAFYGTADIDPTAGALTVTSADTWDIFLCKLDATNSLVWSHSFGGSEGDFGSAVAVDSGGNVYCAGRYANSADFDPGPGSAVLTGSPGALADTFILKMNPAGNYLWAASMGGGSYHAARSMAVDATGAVVTAGYFDGRADFDPGASEVSLLADVLRDMYISKLSANGDYLWAGTFKSGMGSMEDAALAVDASGNAWCTGWIPLTADLDPGPGSFHAPSNGGNDYFLVKLEPQFIPAPGNDAGETNADEMLVGLVSSSGNSLLDNDTDANTGATLTVTAFDATSALGAAVLVNADGTFVYDPTGVPVFQALAPNESLTDSFTYTVSDGTDSAVGTVSIVVFGKDTGLPLLTAPLQVLLVVLLAFAGCAARRPTRSNIRHAIKQG